MRFFRGFFDFAGENRHPEIRNFATLLLSEIGKLSSFFVISGNLQGQSLLHFMLLLYFLALLNRDSMLSMGVSYTIYHFNLAAWPSGLGTCWIVDIDRPVVKEKLGILIEHYVATVTPPVGPAEIPETPKENQLKSF